MSRVSVIITGGVTSLVLYLMIGLKNDHVKYYLNQFKYKVKLAFVRDVNSVVSTI